MYFIICIIFIYYFVSDGDNEGSTADSDYSSGGSDGGSSPSPPDLTVGVSVHVHQGPPPPGAVLYYLVVPAGYQLEFTPLDQLPSPSLPPVHSADGGSMSSLSFDSSVDDESRLEIGSSGSPSDNIENSTTGTTWQRRLVKWSLPPPPVQSAHLPGWSPTP